jgi:integrase
MKRHRKQTGSLWKSRGWWYLRYRAGELQEDGTIKRVQKAERLAPVEGETRSKDSRVLLELADERMRAINGNGTNHSHAPLRLMTLVQFVEQEYLPNAKKELRETSYLTRESIWRNQVKPRAGHIKLREFKTSTGEAVLQEIADEGKVHRNYIRAIKTELSSIFTYARRKDAITTANPMTGVPIPRSAKRLQKRGTYVLADIMRMLAALDGIAKVVVATAAFTGLRRGELQGLEWSDYDGKQLLVTHNIAQGFTGAVKTESSEAAVPVIPYLCKFLDEHRPAASSKFMFSDERGDWLRLGHFARDYVIPVLRTLGITWHGLHAFRRGLATNLHDLGIDDKTVQAIMRHSNVRITQDA